MKHILDFGEFQLDMDLIEIIRKEKRYPLTKREFEILAFFIKNKNKFVTHYTGISFDNLKFHVYLLRKKIGKNTIKTVKGKGYMLKAM